jgi:hypothetical protein
MPLPGGGQKAAKTIETRPSRTDERIPIASYIPEIFTLGDKHLKRRSFLSHEPAGPFAGQYARGIANRA